MSGYWLKKLWTSISRRTGAVGLAPMAKVLEFRSFLESLEDRTAPALFMVTTNADDGGAGTLRQAILDANATPGTDAIAFAIGTGAQTIAPLSALPTITEAVSIDATTQPGWTTAPIIELDGSSVGAGASGFTITSSGSTIRGFVINRFSATGVTISGLGATGNAIAGNYVGTNTTGTAALANAIGIQLSAGASANTIGGTTAGEGNVISGNAGTGVYFNNAADNLVAGNFVGINATGESAIPNGVGIVLENSSTGNLIGGTTAGARNVISGNAGDGVRISGTGTTGNVVSGNYVGTNRDGQGVIPGTVSLWKGDGDTTDAVGGNNGTLLNGATFGSGQVGQAFSLDGINDSVDLGNGANTRFAANEPFSLGAWVKPTAQVYDGDLAVIFGHTHYGNGADYGGYALFFGQNEPFLRFQITAAGLSGYIEVRADYGLDTDWAQVTATYDGSFLASGLRIYKNGVELPTVATANNSLAGKTIAYNSNLYLGRYGDDDSAIPVVGRYPGLIDEAAVYNRALSPGEVEVIYARGAAGASLLEGNAGVGVRIDGGANYNTIGGAAAGAGNVIGGNTSSGVLLDGAGTTNNTIAGNSIGTNAAGAESLSGTVSAWNGEGSGADSVGGNPLTLGAGVGFTAGRFGQAFLFNGVNGVANTARVPNTSSLELALGDYTIESWVKTTNDSGNFQVLVSSYGGTPTFQFGLDPQERAYFELRTNTGSVYISGGPAVNDGAWHHLVGVRIGASFKLYVDNVLVASNTNAAVGYTATGAHLEVGGSENGNYAFGGAMDSIAVYNRGLTDGEVAARYSGTGAIPNATGVLIQNGANNNTIGGAAAGEGNVIGGNRDYGIRIEGSGTNDNKIRGNFIGTNADGTAAIANGFNLLGQGNSVYSNAGIGIYGGASNNVVGGQLPGERNVVAGNDWIGIAIGGVGTDGNVVEGNFIGLASSGTAALGNDRSGVLIGAGASNTRVGGTATAQRNVIGGNGFGVTVWAAGAGNRIEGNFIGTNADGTAALSAIQQAGVYLLDTEGVTVGGSQSGTGNLISGNTDGVWITGSPSTGNAVLGNFIGTNAAGTGMIANGANGVTIQGGAANNTIGGTNSPLVVASFGGGRFAQVSPTGDVTPATDGPALAAVGIAYGPDGHVYVTDRTTNAVYKYDGVTRAFLGTFVAPGSGGLDYPESLAFGPDGNLYVAGSRNNAVLRYDGATGAFFGVFASGGLNGPEDLLFHPDGRLYVTSYYNSSVLRFDGTTGAFLDVFSTAVSNPTGLELMPGGDLLVSSWVPSGAVVRLNAATGAAVGNFVSPASGGLSYAYGIEYAPSGELIVASFGSSQLLRYNGATGSFLGIYAATPANPTFFTFGAMAGNVISGNAGSGVAIDGAGTNDNVVVGNSVGTNAAGTAAIANGLDGIVIRNGASGNQVGGTTAGAGNLVSGNVIVGVSIHGVDATDNTVRGNFIGVDRSGTQKIANGYGVALQFGTTNNTVGGTSAAARNIISGSANAGVYINGGGTSGNTVLGNYIGTNAGGTSAIGNGTDGVVIFGGASSNTIGGVIGGAGNLISGNSIVGVSIYGAGTTKNDVQGNFIGVDKTGTQKIANGYGVALQLGTTNNTIGGTSAGARNIISGSANAGVYISGGGTTGNTVAGNFIGTDASGTAAVGNGSGIAINGGAASNTIGGSVVGSGNVISGNAQFGISINNPGTTLNVVAGNFIGTNLTGTAAVANGFEGVFIGGGATKNTVGTNGDGTGDTAERNIISGNLREGVEVDGGTTDNNIIAGNYIGLDASGSVRVANAGYGVMIGFGPVGNRIGTDGSKDAFNAAERNVISGNGTHNIGIFGLGTANTVVAGNYIGLTASGMAAVTNTGWGIINNSMASNTRIGTNGDGIADLEERNVIGGHALDGILFENASTLGHIVAGNYIGTNALGTAALPNRAGVRMRSSARLVRIGTDGSNDAFNAAERNLISGNSQNGIVLDGSNGGFPHRIAGNIIGLAADGSTKLPNFNGIQIINGNNSNLIGTNGNGIADDLERNIISGNNWQGIEVNTNVSGNIIAGNYIGLNEAGTAAVTNAQYGIWIGNGASSNTIGGTTAARRNVISGNTAGGIAITGSTTTSNTVSGNYIGLNAAGDAKVANGNDGILINNNSSSNTIGGTAAGAGNVISGNARHGVYITGTNTSNNKLFGNTIGTNPAGTAALSYTGFGIELDTAPDTIIGGGQTGAGNLISGNPYGGVDLLRAVRTVVAGNTIGLNRAGDTVIPNGVGMYINFSSSDVRVGTNGDGSSDAGERNVIAGTVSGAIYVQNNTTRTTIAGNYINVNAAGTAAVPGNLNGVIIQVGATNTRLGTNADGVSDDLERNVIAGGVAVSHVGTNNTVIAGNHIGINAAGTASLGQSGFSVGITVSYGSTDTRIGTNADGVNDAAERNVISGNSGWGINIETPLWNGDLPANGTMTSGVVIAGNYVGTDKTGSFAVPNANIGIRIANKATGNIIGGTTAAARNVISGNNGEGIAIGEANTVGNRILGNYIGTNAAGTAAIPNTNVGVVLYFGPAGNYIGGAPAELLVSDHGNQRLKQFGPDVAVPDQITPTTINPLGIAIAPTGHRFVISQNGTLWRYSPTGVLLNTLATGLGDTRNVTIGPDGHIYVAIHNTNQIVRFNGTTFAAMGAFISGLNGPVGLNFGPDGNLYVTETNFGSTGRLLKFNGATGAALGQVGSLNLRWASSPVWDAAGNIYIVERNGNTLLKIDGTTGALIQTLASGGILSGPEYLAIGKDGLIYVSAIFHHSVQKYDPNTGAFVGYAIAPTAGLNLPHGLAFTPEVVAGNVISGNGWDGVQIVGSSATGNVVVGNYLGVNASGTGAIPNGAAGIAVFGGANKTRIGTDGNGSADAAERNIISGNKHVGIYIADVGTTGTVVAGNYVGTDVTGTVAVANLWEGISIGSGATSNRIGTSGGPFAASERNIISGNGMSGVSIGRLFSGPGTSLNTVAGNYIGTDLTGTLDLGNGENGVIIQSGASSNTIGGTSVALRNVIGGNGDDGVEITGSGTTDNHIVGNYIGTDKTGASALGNSGNGVFFSDKASVNYIGTDGDGTNDATERNIISGNSGHAVYIYGSGTNGNVVAGNYLGVDESGIKALGNGAGINIDAGAASNRIGTNSDGTSDADERNIISSNKSTAIYILRTGSDFNVVAGNFIGLDATGQAPLANAHRGILVALGAKSNRIGVAPGSANPVAGRNVISANTWYGIEIASSGSEGNIVAGNYIGTDSSGTQAIGNVLDGVLISSGARNNRVGTDANNVSDLDERNIISGNKRIGVLVHGTGTRANVVAGNYIGTDVGGSAAIPNQAYAGVWIAGGATDNRFGTNADGVRDDVERNVISGNAVDGVVLTEPGTAGNAVAGNYIGTDSTGTVALGNTGSGIKLVNSAGNIIGGAPGAGNVIGGNTGDGVVVTGAGPIGGGVSRFRADGTAGDSIGGNNGTVNGGTTFVPGVSGQAFNFDGTGYVRIPNNPSLNVANVTMAGWIKPVFANRPAVPNDFDQLFSKITGSGDGYGLAVVMDPTATNYYQMPPGGVPKGTVAFFARISSGRQQIFSPTPLPDDGQYHHIAGTFDGATMRLFIDGVEVASRSASGTIINADNDAFIGGQPLNPAPFNVLSRAAIDDVLLANRALSVGEIGLLYSTRGADTIGNLIQGNLIGTDGTGTGALANGGDGVRIEGGAGNNVIGGSLADTNTAIGNVIAHQTTGLNVDATAGPGNTVRFNQFFSNATATINDLGQPPAPTLTGALGGNGARVFGNFAGVANQSYVVDFYTGETANEAKVYLGSATFLANALGAVSIDASFTSPVPFEQSIAAIATRVDTGSSSGLSASATVLGAAIQGIPATAVEGSPINLTAFSVLDAAGISYQWTIHKDGVPYPDVNGVFVPIEAGITFIPKDDGVYSVSLQLTTGTGDTTLVGPIEIIVDNANPRGELRLSAESALVGTTVLAEGLANDAGSFDTHEFLWELWYGPAVGAPIVTGAGANFSFVPTFNGFYRLRLTIEDDDGGVSVIERLIESQGAAPLATIVLLNAGQEGDPVQARAELSQILNGDDLVFEWRVTKNGVAYSFANPTEAAVLFVPDDEGQYRIDLRVSSLRSGLSTDATPLLLSPGNLPPLAILIPPAGSLVSGEVQTWTASVSDPGSADVLSYRWIATLTGSDLAFTGNGAGFSFTPPVGGIYRVSLEVTDDSGASAVASRFATVAFGSLAFTIEGLPTTSVAEGSSVTARGSLSGTYRYDWTVTRDGLPYMAASSSTTANPAGYTATPFDLPFALTDNGTYEVTLVLTAPTGQTGIARRSFGSFNVAPQATLSVISSAPYFEDQEIVFRASPNDPGTDDTHEYRWTVNGVSYPADPANPAEFRYRAPDNGLYTVNVTVVDDGGLDRSDSRTVTVGNSNPILTVRPIPSSNSSLVGLELTAEDVTSDFIASAYWQLFQDGILVADGDGTTMSYAPVSGAAYRVVWTATDEDGGVSVLVVASLSGSADSDTRTINADDVAGVDLLIYQAFEGDDTVVVDSALTIPVILDGGPGDDYLSGGAGNDVLIAGPGSNVLIGNDGDDLFLGGGNDTMDGGTGNDTYRLHFSVVQVIDTAGGTDSLDFSGIEGRSLDIAFDGNPDYRNPFGDGSADRLSLVGDFESARGTDAADTFRIGVDDFTLFGGEGADVATVEGGSRITVDLGTGANTVKVVGGEEITIFGGEGVEDNAVLISGTTRRILVTSPPPSPSTPALGSLNVTVAGGEEITIFGGENDLETQVEIGGTASKIAFHPGSTSSTVTITDGEAITIFGGEDGTDGAVTIGGAATRIQVQAGPGALAVDVTGGEEITIFGGESGSEAEVSVSGTAKGVLIAGAQDPIDVTVGGGEEITIFAGEGPIESQVVVSGDASNVRIYSRGIGTDIRVAGGEEITIFGGEGDTATDVDISGSASSVIFVGGAGKAAVVVRGGEEITIFGGTGSDETSVEIGGNASKVAVVGVASRLDVSVAGGEEITIFGGESDSSTNVEITGESRKVTVVGTRTPLNVTVGGGNEITIFGGEGDEATDVRIEGPAKNVAVVASKAPLSVDVVAGEQITIFGGAGDDPTEVAIGGSAKRVVVKGDAAPIDAVISGGEQITIFGGDGPQIDTVRVGGSAKSVLLSTGGGEDRVTISGGESITIFGGEGDDDVEINGGSEILLAGGDGDDAIAVTAGKNVIILTDAGNDRAVVAGGEEITIFGGEGDDSAAIRGTAKSVLVSTWKGNDGVTVEAGEAITIFGGEDDDTASIDGGKKITVILGSGKDKGTVSGGDEITIFGGEGDDEIAVSGGSKVIGVGDSGDDTIAVTDGIDITIFGGEGDDEIVIDTVTGRVQVLGSEGGDTIRVRRGLEISIDGGLDRDLFTVSGGERITVFGSEDDDSAAIEGGRFVKFLGDAGNDRVTITGGDSITVSGGLGNDALDVTGEFPTNIVLFGDSGNDLIRTDGSNSVVVSAGRGNDILILGRGADILAFGDDGDDAYVFANLGSANIRLKELINVDSQNFDQPSRGRDVLDFTAFSTGIVYNLSLHGNDADLNIGRQTTGDVASWLFGTFEGIYGTDGADRLIGDNDANALIGNGGDDTLIGLGGDDTLVGGAGNDSLAGGLGDDWYLFHGVDLNHDVVIENANQGIDTLDFSGRGLGVVVDLSSTAKQTVDATGGTLRLTSAFGLDNVVGTFLDDQITGNGLDNQIAGLSGNDTLAGGAGNDVYYFAGSNAGTDEIVEASDDPGIDTLDFTSFEAPLVLDLSLVTVQSFGTAGGLRLADPEGLENIVGTGFADVLKGNANANTISGFGGRDFLDGRAGNDTLYGGLTQVVYLDFATATNASRGDFDYLSEFSNGQLAADEIVARLQSIFAGLDYRFTRDLGEAQALTEQTGREFVTLVFNDGPGGGIGGESGGLDFRNLIRNNRGTVNVNDLLGHANQPEESIENVVGLSTTIAAHELGHMAGLRHADALGPIGAGLFAGMIAWNPNPSEATSAIYTPFHIMSSPQSLGSTLADAAGPTYFGERELIKLSFADTGTAIRENGPAPGSHAGFDTALALGELPALNVHNTIGDRESAYVPAEGQDFSWMTVSAISVSGALELVGGAVETDMYSFHATAGEIISIEMISASIRPSLANAVDGVLRVYDAQGQLVMTSDNDFETVDPLIFDLFVVSAGLYFVEVSSQTPTDTGRYELFIARFGPRIANTPPQGTGDTLTGGAGSDVLIGTTANDVFGFTKVDIDEFDFIDGRLGYDIVETDSDPEGNFEAVDIEEIVKIVTPIELAPLPPQTVAEGQTLLIPVVASRPNLLYHLEAAPTDDYPTGISIDPLTGLIRFTPADEGEFAVKVVATSLSGQVADQIVRIVSTNVAPILGLAGPDGAFEGETWVGSGSVADPGADEWTVTVDYGDGLGWQTVAMDANRGFTLANRYVDSGVYTVSVHVTDHDGGTDERRWTVTVHNTAPTAVLGNSGDVVEGTSNPPLISFSGISEVSPADRAAGLRYSYDFDNDGIWDLGGSDYESSVTSSSVIIPAMYVNDGDAIRTVRARIYDVDNDHSEYFTTFTIFNALPTATLTVPAEITVNEGSEVLLTGNGSDPGLDTLAYLWRAIGASDPNVYISNATELRFTPLDDDRYEATFRVTDSDGAYSERTAIVNVLNVSPILSVGGDTSTNPGVPLSRLVSFTDPGADQWTAEVNYGDGSGWQSATISADKQIQLHHAYARGGLFTVQVQMTDGDGGRDLKSFTVLALNPPTVGIGAPDIGVRYQTRTFTFTVSTPLPNPAVEFEYRINWGDGSPAAIVPRTTNNGALTLDHAYSALGNYSVMVQVVDQYGQMSNTAVHRIAIEVANIQLIGPTRTLFVAGGDGSEQIRIRFKEGKDDDIAIQINNVDVGQVPWRDRYQSTLIDAIEVHGNAGDDTIRIDKDLPLSILADGGSGNDTILGSDIGNVLIGGPGNDVLTGGNGRDTLMGGDGDDSLSGGDGDDFIWAGSGNDSIDAGDGDDVALGEAGNDTISGGKGRDILIGGTGADSIVGDAGDDLLIAGYTLFDNDAVALRKIFNEWTSSNTYEQRVFNLKNGTGAAAGIRLNGNDGADQTVFTDNDVDTLIGSSGSDWFFANRTNDNGGPLDKLLDLNGNEIGDDTDM